MGWTLLAPIVARLFKDASWWLLIAGVCLVGAIVLRRAFAPAPPLPTAFGTTTAVHRGNAMSVKVGWRTREGTLTVSPYLTGCGVSVLPHFCGSWSTTNKCGWRLQTAAA